MEYLIKMWEDEQCREHGISTYHLETYAKKEEAIMDAKRLFYRENYAAVEVVNEFEDLIYLIANDVPEGEYGD